MSLASNSSTLWNMIKSTEHRTCKLNKQSYFSYMFIEFSCIVYMFIEFSCIVFKHVFCRNSRQQALIIPRPKKKYQFWRRC